MPGGGHRQKNDAGGGGSESQELFPRPGGNNKEKEVTVKEKPSFELSGALLEDTNTFLGAVIKYTEPPEAHTPRKLWHLYPFKNDEVLPVMYIHQDKSAYLLGDTAALQTLQSIAHLVQRSMWSGGHNPPEPGNPHTYALLLFIRKGENQV
uniref:smad nuclear-interacting protein 1-like n=1 Tax=Callithrix jacchus TaxID=9483 RepID=UPI0023DD62DF|nr:smad nuclear-interacting protein 1-like [Callithrix jacchus]